MELKALLIPSLDVKVASQKPSNPEPVISAFIKKTVSLQCKVHSHDPQWVQDDLTQLTTECKAAESCFLNKLWGRYQACRPVYSKASLSLCACQCLCTDYSLSMGPFTPCWHWDFLNSSTTPSLSLNSPQKLGHFQDFSKYLLCCKINSLSPEATPTFLVTSEFNSLSFNTSLTQIPHLFVSDSTFSLKVCNLTVQHSPSQSPSALLSDSVFYCT